MSLDALFPFSTEVLSIAPAARVGLVVVDPSVGFTRSGAFADPERMAPMVAAIAAEHRALSAALGDRLRVLVFLDTHRADVPEPPYPPHGVVGSGEEEIDPDLAHLLRLPGVSVIRKDCINGFVGAIDRRTGANAVCRWVIDEQLDALLVCGDCTDICVGDFVVTALSARNHGLFTAIDPEVDREGYVAAVTGLSIGVLAGACATYDSPIHPVAASHHAGLWWMSRRGARILSGWQAGGPAR